MSKLYLALFSLTFLFLFSSCKDEVNPLLTNSTGKLKMSIDKANAPTNVFFVKATLTKENCNEVDATLNLKSDTTADITIDNLDAGQWQLKVEAFDSLMSLKYSGEADVTITEDYLTQINLTLSPVGSGKGSISICVVWGSSNNNNNTLNLKDCPFNPIFTTSTVPGTPQNLGQNTVIYDNGKYKIWFNNIYPSAVGSIYYGESTDGIHWTYPSSKAVLSPTVGGWDSQFALLGTVMKDGDTYRMYYSGKSYYSEQISLGYATSSDGINWMKQNDPIIIPGVSAMSIGACSVIKFNSKYYMYCTLKYNDDIIGVATSTDGIHFDNFQELKFTNTFWIGSNITGLSIICENGLLKAVFPNRNEDFIGYATSTDGLNWEVDNKFVFNYKYAANNWFSTLTYPSLVKVDNGYRVYYNGAHHNLNSTSSALGFFTFNK